MARIRLNLAVGTPKINGVPFLSAKSGATTDSVSGDVELDFDNTKVTSISILRHAFRSLLDMARASGLKE